MKIKFIIPFCLSLICIPGFSYAQAGKILRAGRAASKLPAVKVPKLKSVNVKVPTVANSLKGAHYKNIRLQYNLDQMHQRFPQLTRLRTKTVALTEFPSLAFTPGFSIFPQFQQKAVATYRRILAEYKGVSSFTQPEDFTAWGEAMAAVANLGLFGGADNALEIVQVYQQVPAEAKSVSATVILRSLLSIGAEEEAARFAQIAASDGALVGDFALGMENNSQNAVQVSPQTLDAMKSALVEVQPLTAIHFDPSAQATTKWMEMRKDIEKAVPEEDWSGFVAYAQQKMKSLSEKELKMLLGPLDGPVYAGVSPEEAKNIQMMARQEMDRRIALQEYQIPPKALKKDPEDEAVSVLSGEEVVEVPAGQEEPLVEGGDDFPAQQHFLANKQEEFSVQLGSAASSGELDGIIDGRAIVSDEFSPYTFEGLNRAFWQQKVHSMSVPHRINLLRKQVQNLQQQILASQSLLEKGFSHYSGKNSRNKTTYWDIVENIQRLQKNSLALPLLEEYNIIKLFVQPHEKYFLKNISFIKENNYSLSFVDLQEEFKTLSGMFPQYDWTTVSRQMEDARRYFVRQIKTDAFNALKNSSLELERSKNGDPNLQELYRLKQRLIHLLSMGKYYKRGVPEAECQQKLHEIEQEIERVKAM